MNHTIDLSGQVALVTGGGRGIGRQIALHLSKSGATIALAARTVSQLNDTVDAITAQGGNAFAFQMDVTKALEVRDCVSEIIDRFGFIDLLVNNAGIGLDRAVTWQIDPEDWWHVFKVNVRGAFLCTHAILPGMIARNQGRIINIGSNAGIKSSPMISAYGASKAALLHLSNSIESEINDMNLSIFTFSPGLVYTNMTKDIPIFKNLPDSAWTPIERVGEICLILASGKADKLSGRYFHIREDNLEALIINADKIIEEDAQVLHLLRLAV